MKVKWPWSKPLKLHQIFNALLLEIDQRHFQTPHRVRPTEQPDLIEKWLDPKAEIFFCFRNIHFFVVKMTLGKRQLLKWDCQAGGESFCSQPRKLNWADK
jgi:hypothetical protein